MPHTWEVFYCPVMGVFLNSLVAKGSGVIEKIRLSKCLSEKGLCSRREADEYIQRGLVSVDGVRITELGTKVFPTQTIQLHREAKDTQSNRITILLNKPIGYVSAQPEGRYKAAAQLVQRDTHFRGDRSERRFQNSHTRGLAPAGRLDIDSQGLLVLTQDGRIAKHLIGEDSSVDKEYLVRVQGRLRPNGLQLLNHGLSLDGHVLKPADVRWINDDQLRFVLNEGRKRQIRRMCEMVGLKVTGLKRIRIGRVRLGDLPIGQWRYLGENERF